MSDKPDAYFNFSIAEMRYAGSNACIKGLSLRSDGGEVVGIHGKTGSGKSTVFRAMAGLNSAALTQIDGVLTLRGREYPLAEMTAQRASDLGITYLFQQVSSTFNPRKTIGYHLKRQGKDTFTDADIESNLKVMNLPELGEVAGRYPSSFSGGELQRLALLMIRLKDPHVLMLDEPFVSLDEDLMKGCLGMIRAWADKGKLILISSHIINPLKGISDKIYHLKDGGLHPSESGEFQVDNKESRPATVSRDCVLSVRDLRVFYGTTAEENTLIAPINMKIKAGEFILIRGNSGAGKSTLLRQIAGIDNKGSGRIIEAVSGRDVSTLDRIYRRSIVQYIPQDPFGSFPPYRTTQEILVDLLLYGQNKSKIEDFMGHMQLDLALLEKRVAELSGGQRQLMLFLIAIVIAPKLYLIDEGLSALDSKTSKNLLEYFNQLREGHRISIVYVSHQPALLMRYLDSVYSIKDKRLQVEKIETLL